MYMLLKTDVHAVLTGCTCNFGSKYMHFRLLVHPFPKICHCVHKCKLFVQKNAARRPVGEGGQRQGDAVAQFVLRG